MPLGLLVPENLYVCREGVSERRGLCWASLPFSCYGALAFPVTEEGLLTSFAVTQFGRLHRAGVGGVSEKREQEQIASRVSSEASAMGVCECSELRALLKGEDWRGHCLAQSTPWMPR